KQLIDDEGHRNPMTVAELETRMAGWLAGEYQAVIFAAPDGQALGYALFRRETGHVYLRQFFVFREYRRSGIGRAGFQWLRSNLWRDTPRVRIDVLVGNHRAIAFWRAVGFRDYCLTMET